MNSPVYDLNKIKFSTDPATYERAVGLIQNGKVRDVKESLNGFQATVIGTEPYRVVVGYRQYEDGDCTCYLGERGEVCKHMVALALYVVLQGAPVSAEDMRQYTKAVCSKKIGELSNKELLDVKQQITVALKYIKPYDGPSRIWFRYQSSLSEGCARITALASELPVSKQTAKILVDLLIRMERKLMNGVDDSDGTVGSCMEELVLVLNDFAILSSECIECFGVFCGMQTSFGWEESLVRLYTTSN